jgi:hypothetical protein
MPMKADTEEQIAAVLQQRKAGGKVADICGKVRISEELTERSGIY